MAGVEDAFNDFIVIALGLVEGEGEVVVDVVKILSPDILDLDVAFVWLYLLPFGVEPYIDQSYKGTECCDGQVGYPSRHHFEQHTNY